MIWPNRKIENTLYTSATAMEIPLRKPPFTNKTITEHDSEITVVDKIGIKNAGVDQLGDEHQNYEIAGVEYEKMVKFQEWIKKKHNNCSRRHASQ